MLLILVVYARVVPREGGWGRLARLWSSWCEGGVNYRSDRVCDSAEISRGKLARGNLWVDALRRGLPQGDSSCL